MKEIGLRSDQLTDSPKEGSRVIRVIEARHSEHANDKRKIWNRQNLNLQKETKQDLISFFEIILYHSTFQHYLCTLLLVLLAQMVILYS